MLQETSLYDFDLSICNSIHQDFYDKSISAIETSSGILVGGPHGGLAILWQPSLGAYCKVQTHNDKLVMGIELTDNTERK